MTTGRLLPLIGELVRTGSAIREIPVAPMEDRAEQGRLRPKMRMTTQEVVAPQAWRSRA